MKASAVTDSLCSVRAVTVRTGLPIIGGLLSIAKTLNILELRKCEKQSLIEPNR